MKKFTSLALITIMLSSLSAFAAKEVKSDTKDTATQSKKYQAKKKTLAQKKAAQRKAAQKKNAGKKGKATKKSPNLEDV